MKKLIPIIIALIAIGMDASAQTGYVQQYFATPLLVNPAMTGLIPTDYRAAAHTRPSLYPYLSFEGNFSFDMSVLQGKLSKKNGLGIGFVTNYYHYPYGHSGSTVGLSAAYHRALDNRGDHIISVGGQGFFNKAKRDYAFDSYTFSVARYNTGIMYSGNVSRRLSLYAGYSIYSINRPTLYFPGGAFTPPFQSQLHAGGSFSLVDDIMLHANLFYARQDPYGQTAIGAHMSFPLNFKKQGSKALLYIGARYWHSFAVAPYMGIEWKRSKIGFSYDTYISDGWEISNENAFELSYIYSGMFTKAKRASLTSRAIIIR
jgi:type IX secretion system PorP/SprF family membrane protein